MKIAYMYDKHVGNFHYGKGHPMKPHRTTIAHSLVHSYGLDTHMSIVVPPILSAFSYHTEAYLNSLGALTPFNDDCPSFSGLRDFCFRYASGSVGAARLLSTYDAAINWSGGLHHGRKAEPSGFCYINDIVLAILELLGTHERVMYIDIDIHHGDGVEEAFYDSSRVLTLSFHKFGDNYFPGTGDLMSNGIGGGRGYALNVPLKTGIDDAAYRYVYEPVVAECIRRFDPGVIVMQCGADSLAGDRLGCFNLSIHGHGECVKFVKQFNRKMLVLGGGGYNVRNVSRCWAYETALLCGKEVPNEIPACDPYYGYFGGDQVLHPVLVGKYENMNSRAYLDCVIGYVTEAASKLR